MTRTENGLKRTLLADRYQLCFSFLGSVWECTAPEAPPRAAMQMIHERLAIRQSEPAGQWVPRQSIGTSEWRWPRSASIREHFLMIVFFITIFSARLSSCGTDDEWKSSKEIQKRVVDRFEEPKDCKPLHRENRIWINRDEQVVILDGYIAQRDVPLELFACPIGTKEHESIVAVFARAQLVHAGLLAINARPGSTATFEPFMPAHGTTVRVYALWLDSDGKTKGTLAQNWIRVSGTKKPMVWDWVFGGSKIYKDDEGKEHYLGDSGELISVSNFTTSTMDVAIQSDQSNANLMFEAFTDRIPPKNSPVRLVLTLTDEAPYGSMDNGPIREKQDEPKYLTAKVPDNILSLLVAKPVATPDPKPAKVSPPKIPSSNTKK